MNKALQDKLSDRKKNGQLRILKTNAGLIDFASNDYLGLSRNQELINNVSVSYQALGASLGSGGSRLLAGNSIHFEALEAFLAQVHCGESSLLMNSGYVANLSVFSTIPQKGDTVLYDELIHTCIKDGVRLSHANHFSFKHNDLESLESKLKKATGTVYVAIESIYSMDGDEAPLKSIARLCKEYGAYLIVDEAHSTGVYGQGGSGLCCALGIEKEVFIRIHTFGKAIGCHGACVIASNELKEYLINFARPFIYTTAMPLHAIVSIREAYKYLSANSSIQDYLQTRIDFFKKTIDTSIESQSPVQILIISGNHAVKKKAELMQKSGFDVRPVLSPTVKEGVERLRICIHEFNTNEEIEKLGALLNS